MAYSADPTLWLYTSLTAGSSHVITATSRLETILKANKIPFRALDVATDEKARMLWGRRSKGRKLPGLVKYGSVIGDLEEVEEWNEYGELKQQLSAIDAGAGIAPTASTAASAATPAASTATSSKPESSLAAPPSEPQPRSRSASASRHISISEPADSHDTPAPSKKDETPLTMAMRQAGAEAAAKAGQMKSKKATPIAPEKDKEPDNVADTTAPMVDEPMVDKSMADPEAATQITAGKTPAQLASEGARKTSVDKIAESEESSSAASTPDETPSKEEQVLQLRRQSSVAKQKSSLSAEVEPEDVEGDASEAKETVEEEDEEQDEETAVDTSAPMTEPPPVGRTHRGRSISDGSKEEIAEVEKRNAIPEEDEEDDDEDGNEDEGAKKEKELPESTGKADKKPQEQDPKSAEDAGVSVGD